MIPSKNHTARRLRETAVAVVAAILLVAVAPAAMADYSPVTRATWVPNSGVHSVAVAGPYLYLGGTFTSWRNASTGQVVTRTRLARINAITGALDLTWAPTASDDVLATRCQRTAPGCSWADASGPCPVYPGPGWPQWRQLVRDRW